MSDTGVLVDGGIEVVDASASISTVTCGVGRVSFGGAAEKCLLSGTLIGDL